MARPQKNQVAQRQLATNIKRLERTKPDTTVRKIEKWGWTHGLDVGNQSVRNALRGEIDPTACAVELLVLLSGYFEAPPAELGTYAEERINAVMAIALPGTTGPEGGHHLHSDGFGWLPVTAGEGHIGLCALPDPEATDLVEAA